ncbi:MAG TPA: hypothetical protein VKA84_06690 [Gemmatimonadaceae bacterium]|nr:hypothetical protein [Gemmatimonadaceae bacterium]
MRAPPFLALLPRLPMLAHLLGTTLATFVSTHSLLVLVLLMLLAPYWLGPVLVRLTSKSSDAPQFEPFDGSADREPPPVTAHIARATGSLAGEGFRTAADLVLHGHMDNIVTRVRLFENPATDEAAIAAGVYTLAGELGAMTMLVEFSTEFRDGSSRMTGNSPRPGVYARRPDRTIERFPEMADAASLCRVHRALLRRHHAPRSVAPSRYRTAPARGLAEGMVREMEGQVAAGYLWKDAAARAYRPTLKGAVLMCWKLLPPAAGLRRAAGRRRAAKLLRELGDWNQPHQPKTSDSAASPRSVTTAQSGHAFSSSR